MQFSTGQTDTLSKYLADISKILVGSAVVGFFVPSSAGPVSASVFAAGTSIALACLAISIKLAK